MRSSAADPAWSPELSWEITRASSGEVHLILRGAIAEGAALAPLIGGARRVVIDLAAVHWMDTAGAFRLLSFLRLLECRAEAVRCSPAVVDQLHRMPALARMLRVRSLIVPLACPHCGVVTDELVDPGDPHLPVTFVAALCAACGQPIDLVLPRR